MYKENNDKRTVLRTGYSYLKIYIWSDKCVMRMYCSIIHNVRSGGAGGMYHFPEKKRWMASLPLSLGHIFTLMFSLTPSLFLSFCLLVCLSVCLSLWAYLSLALYPSPLFYPIFSLLTSTPVYLTFYSLCEVWIILPSKAVTRNVLLCFLYCKIPHVIIAHNYCTKSALYLALNISCNAHNMKAITWRNTWVVFRIPYYIVVVAIFSHPFC